MSRRPSTTLVLFGKRIRQLRLEKKWSQETLGEEWGLRAYLSGIERKRNLGIDNIVTLARALKVDAGQLFKGVR